MSSINSHKQLGFTKHFEKTIMKRVTQARAITAAQTAKLRKTLTDRWEEFQALCTITDQQTKPDRVNTASVFAPRELFPLLFRTRSYQLAWAPSQTPNEPDIIITAQWQNGKVTHAKHWRNFLANDGRLPAARLPEQETWITPEPVKAYNETPPIAEKAKAAKKAFKEGKTDRPAPRKNSYA